MSNSSVPAVQFTPTGLLLPTEADILAGVQADMNAAFGGDLSAALSTPQGQLASSQTAVIGAANDLFAKFVNQVNPDFADGAMQDAIARIYFLTRNPARPTAVQCDCLGVAGTVIPIGAQAQATDGNIYVCTLGGTIPVSGTISLPFACLTAGPITCPATTLNKIYQGTNGWDTINNPGNGVPGTLVESRADFAYRRQQSVALNAKGSLASIYANVFSVANVLDVYATENSTNNPVAVGATGFVLAPHSLYVAAVGGLPADIAAAIWAKKNEGSDYNGNTTVIVTDQSGYSYPYPTYSVKYQIPTGTPVKFAVQLTNNSLLPADIMTQVKNAIVAAFAGADGGQRARIGSAIFASRFYAPVALLGPSVSILSIKIGTVTANLDSVTMGIDQAPTVAATDIAVTLV